MKLFDHTDYMKTGTCGSFACKPLTCLITSVTFFILDNRNIITLPDNRSLCFVLFLNIFITSVYSRKQKQVALLSGRTYLLWHLSLELEVTTANPTIFISCIGPSLPKVLFAPPHPTQEVLFALTRPTGSVICTTSPHLGVCYEY